MEKNKKNKDCKIDIPLKLCHIVTLSHCHIRKETLTYRDFSPLGKIKHTVLLHDLQELDDNLGRRSDQDLSLAGLLGVVDSVQGVGQYRGSGHSIG